MHNTQTLQHSLFIGVTLQICLGTNGSVYRCPITGETQKTIKTIKGERHIHNKTYVMALYINKYQIINTDRWTQSLKCIQNLYSNIPSPNVSNKIGPY